MLKEIGNYFTAGKDVSDARKTLNRLESKGESLARGKKW